MQPVKVNFTEEKETLLITLYCKAMQSQSKNPILQDAWAEDAVSRIEYDFSKLKVGLYRSQWIAIRSKKFDMITSKYLSENPDSTVLHLGCGMDSRIFRVNPPVCAHWYDLDYPEVIELRRRLYRDRAGYDMIGSSLADLDWLNNLPKDRPAIIIAEGVTMYLTEEIMKRLLNRLTDWFPHGEIAFDTLSRGFIKWLGKNASNARATGATFGWGINDPQDVKSIEPRLDVVMEFKTTDLPEYSKIPLGIRMLTRFMDVVPALRRMHVPLVYRF